jgi:hypothetical protein
MNKIRLIIMILTFSFVFMLKGIGQEGKTLILEYPEQSAESSDSPEEYAEKKALEKEPKPTVKVTGYFVEPEFIPAPKIIRENEKTEEKKEEKNLKNKIVYWAKKFLSQGTRFISINGKQVAIYKDCSNFARAVYWKAMGIDLFYESVNSGAGHSGMRSGCELLFHFFRKKQRYTSKKPRMGDIVFFDNTYDKNRNQRWDDPLTHVGVVISVAKDGTVEFVHGNVGRPKSIKEAYLNTNDPNSYRKNGKVINTYLRRKYRWERKSERNQMAGELVKGFGGF